MKGAKEKAIFSPRGVTPPLLLLPSSSLVACAAAASTNVERVGRKVMLDSNLGRAGDEGVELEGERDGRGEGLRPDGGRAATSESAAELEEVVSVEEEEEDPSPRTPRRRSRAGPRTSPRSRAESDAGGCRIGY